jgi:hypothetical protein
LAFERRNMRRIRRESADFLMFAQSSVSPAARFCVEACSLSYGPRVAASGDSSGGLRLESGEAKRSGLSVRGLTQLGWS